MRRCRIYWMTAGIWGLIACGIVQGAKLPAVKPEPKPAVVAPAKQVDFRYAIPWWQSAACLPDDPDKVLVGKEGQFLTDYTRGGKGVRSFDVFIQHDVAGGAKWVKQELYSARVPLLRTIKQSGDVSIEEDLFATVPPEDETLSEPLLCRVGGEKVVAGWDAAKVERVLVRLGQTYRALRPGLRGHRDFP
jgi:hypothetical protein